MSNTTIFILILGLFIFNLPETFGKIYNDKTKLKESNSRFYFNNTNFILDGQVFQILAGEVHYARIPEEYWRHRIQMIKALGLNTLSVYIMWNYHEVQPGVFDFTGYGKNLSKFLDIANQEGMYVLIRPGPYVCAEWDFGGHPYWLLKDDNME